MHMMTSSDTPRKFAQFGLNW